MIMENEIQRRLAAYGSQGEAMSLLAGDETLEELREMIIEFSEACPIGRNHPYCPFRILSGLSYDSLTNLVSTMSRDTCIALFAQELKCRSLTETPCRNKWVAENSTAAL